MTTALGIYELYLNGEPVGTDALKPGLTHPEKTKIAYTYDLTRAFHKAAGAENVLSAQVTPGWWADKVVTPNGHDGMVGRKPAFRAVLELTFADGSKRLVGTDTENWTAGIAGPVTHAGIFDGEAYDARILPGYRTPEKLKNPEINNEFSGEIVPTAGAEICYWQDLAIKPVEAYTYKDIEGTREGEYGKVVRIRNYRDGETMTLGAGQTLVIDFGQNAAATGRDAARYEAMEQEAKTYLRDHFLREDGTFQLEILNTMQTPALFALKLNLLDGAAREAMIARLRENFAAHDGCLQTGFLGTSILMQTLTENGMADIAWNLLFQRKNPSWLYSIDNGATTIWERWNSYTLESGMGPKGMNSFNHYAYGCVCQWLWETAAGIAADPAEPGFRHILMQPVPDKRLGSIDAVYHSAAGAIRSAWKYEGDVCHWTFTIPEGCSAAVTLPGENETRTYGPGTHKLSF